MYPKKYFCHCILQIQAYVSVLELASQKTDLGIYISIYSAIYWNILNKYTDDYICIHTCIYIYLIFVFMI